MATDTAIYTLGLNAGQLGHLKGDKHIAVSKNDASCIYNLELLHQCCSSSVNVQIGNKNSGNRLSIYFARVESCENVN